MRFIRFSLKQLFISVSVICLLLAVAVPGYLASRRYYTPYWLVETPGKSIPIFVNGEFVGNSPTPVPVETLFRTAKPPGNPIGGVYNEMGVFQISPFQGDLTTVISTGSAEPHQLTQDCVYGSELTPTPHNKFEKGRITLELWGPRVYDRLKFRLPVTSPVVKDNVCKIGIIVPADRLEKCSCIIVDGKIARRDVSASKFTCNVSADRWERAGDSVIVPVSFEPSKGSNWVTLVLGFEGTNSSMMTRSFLVKLP